MKGKTMSIDELNQTLTYLGLESFIVTGPFDEKMEERPSVFSTATANSIAFHPQTEAVDLLAEASAQGAREERARFMAKLETCRPTEVAYSRRDWAIEEKGKRELFDKIMKALGAE
jgi:hypothetical protein